MDGTQNNQIISLTTFPFKHNRGKPLRGTYFRIMMMCISGSENAAAASEHLENNVTGTWSASYQQFLHVAFPH